MKAAQIQKYGGNDVFELTTIVPEFTPQVGQLKIAVHASSINPVDIAFRAGYMEQMVPLSFPAVIGGDFAGIITEVGEGVTLFKRGDEVFGQANPMKKGRGAFSEFTVAQAESTALKPVSLDFTRSAALPLVGTSALQALEEQINIQEGQRILIHGGAGGIGSLAIQLAKLHKAYVITTVSKESEAFVKSLGADQVVDYRTQQFDEIVSNVDAVLDTVGGETMERSFSVLKSGGILVTMAGQPDQKLAEEKGITAIGQMTAVSTPQLNRLRELIDTNKLKVQIDKVFSLDQIKEAFDYFETGSPKGKVVITIKE